MTDIDDRWAAVDGARLRTRDEPDAVRHEILPLWNATVGGGGEQEDVGYYLRLVAATRRPVVELGVGYGRVARWTRPDYGVDESVRMLRHSSARVPGMTVVVARVQDYMVSERARLSYAPQNLMSLLGGPDETMEALSTIWRNTAPHGELAFDVAMPNWDRIRAQLDRPQIRGQVGDLRLSYLAELLSVDTHAGHGALRMHHLVERLDTAGEVRTRISYPPLPVHYFSPRRWSDLLARTGWLTQDCWGGFNNEPLRTSSRRQVWLVRR